MVFESDHPAPRRAARACRCLREVPVPRDTLVKTGQEVERTRHVPASLIHDVLERGQVLYGCASAFRLIQGWLIKAQSDRDTARKLAEHPNPLLDTAIYPRPAERRLLAPSRLGEVSGVRRGTGACRGRGGGLRSGMYSRAHG